MTDLGVGKARFELMLTNLKKRIEEVRLEEEYEMKLFQDVRLQVKLIWISIAILAVLQIIF